MGVKTHKIKSSPQKAVENLNREKGGGWAYNPKTRGAFNPLTGEKISRRQLDKNYGLLKAQGFSGYEAKSKSRKSGGLAGFKAPASFPQYSERTFTSRAEMMRFLRSVKNNDYIFRVKLSGYSTVEKYRENGSDHLDHAYSEQLAFMSAEDMTDAESPQKYDKKTAEYKFKEVKFWTLVAKKAN